MMDKQIVERDPHDLNPHPLNKELFTDLSTDSYQQLKEDIEKRGIQDPLHITKENTIISGHQRQRIARELEIQVPCIIRDDLKEDWQIEEQLISDNLLRRHLSDYQKVVCSERLRDIERGKAKQRQGTRTDLKENFPVNFRESDKHKRETNAILANKVGMSGRQYDKARKIYHTAPEDIKEKWQSGELSTHGAYKKLQVEEKKKRRKESTETPPLPTDRYEVLYVDCPWRYDFSKDTSDEIEQKYSTMTVQELKELDIPAAENAVIYMWATAPKLIEALEVMDAWGFTYKTNAIWDKEWIGMGFWFRGQHELLLVGTKGSFSPPKEKNRVSSVFRKKREEHSKKPDEIQDHITEAFPNRKKIELFARRKKDGWASWGDEL